MKITNISNITQLYKGKAETKQNEVKQKDKDTVDVSEVGKDYQKVLKSLSGVEDVREEKIANIKKQIEEGNYNVSASDIADKILSRRE